jgi:hypothetical protein
MLQPDKFPLPVIAPLVIAPILAFKLATAALLMANFFLISVQSSIASTDPVVAGTLASCLASTLEGELGGSGIFDNAIMRS